MDATSAAGMGITGQALAMFAFDVGLQIDLDAAEPLVQEATRRRVVRARRPSPEWFDYSPLPLALAVHGDAVEVGDRSAEPTTEMLIYDFGAAVITYRVPLPDTLADLPALASRLYDHAGLRRDAEERVRRVTAAIRPAIDRPDVSDAVEDYLVFAMTSWDDGKTPAGILDSDRDVLARAIEAETSALSSEQVRRSTEGTISYSPDDLAIIDWNAAIVFDSEPEDVIAVLQHANVELLKLRVLDQELDAILDKAHDTLATVVRRHVWPGVTSGRMLVRLASAQTEAALMFEGVNNAIKLVGQQYLARLHRLSADRLDLPAWEASVQRKLGATESLYQKMADTASTRRIETLEWVIIVLIAVSIILPFTPWYY